VSGCVNELIVGIFTFQLMELNGDRQSFLILRYREFTSA
jgi:hypothetical protein